jgi:hypothetical protein
VGNTGCDVAHALEITDPDALTAFAKVLMSASDKLGELPGKIRSAQVSASAFGDLPEAHDVASAYAQRLPNTEDNLKSAGQIAEELAGDLKTAVTNYQQTEATNTATMKSSGQGL